MVEKKRDKKGRHKKKSVKAKNNVDNLTLSLILIGSIGMIMGLLIGDLEFNTYTLSYVYLILLGFTLQVLAVSLFYYRKVKQNP